MKKKIKLPVILKKEHLQSFCPSLWIPLEYSAVTSWPVRVCPAGKEQGFHSNYTTLYICLHTFFFNKQARPSCSGLNYILLASGEKTAVTWQHQWGVRWLESNLNPHAFLWVIHKGMKRCWTQVVTCSWQWHHFKLRLLQSTFFIVLDQICTFSKFRKHFLLFFFPPAWEQNISCTVIKIRCCFARFLYTKRRKTGENKTGIIC